MPPDAGSELDALLPRFGLTNFRPGQREVISTVLSGRDCLCVMPTGGGKSLCYQLPAVALQGLTLVVSPLIALMKDQVDQLQTRGLPVTFINSTLSLAEQYDRLDRMAAGEYQLVYVVPERFRSSRFLESVRAVGLKLLAIDEAHCISEWGHDFRPDYARLGKFRHMLGNPTTIALTATATDAVRRDIVEQLDLNDPRTFITGFARPNLFYEVRVARGERHKLELLTDFLRETPGSGIIYTSSRKKTEEVAEQIAEQVRRSTVVYHAGLLAEQRHAAQEAFMGSRAEIVVATNAFGMGIDKPDVRFVVHYNMPGTIEAYYQEAGRAGRDGKPSRCFLLYYASDRYIQEFFIENAYPSRESMAAVYEFLRHEEGDPIELTQQEIKEALELSIGMEGIGACEQILETAGVLERLVASQNMATVRIDSDLPTLVDLLPRQATVRRKVLRSIEKLVGPRRNELVQFRPRDLAEAAEVEPTSLASALRELNALDVFTYIPPFRGRAIRMIERDAPFEKLDIDFDNLERRKAAEFEKLNRVIQFALSPRCRQQEILRYFGEANPETCGHCDNCGSSGVRQVRKAAAPTLNENALKIVRIALSGVARASARFPCGKNLIAQMLCGSTSNRMEKLRLNRLSTFGLLQHLKQTDVAMLLEGLVVAGLLEQTQFDSNRPVVQLTSAGAEVMKGTTELQGDLPVPAELMATLRGDPAPSARTEADTGRDRAGSTSEPTEEESADPEIVAALKTWRRQQSIEEGLPGFMILSNAALESMARQQPRSTEELRGVKGIGEAKVRKYGTDLLAILKGDAAKRPKDERKQPAKLPRREIPEDMPPKIAFDEPNAELLADDLPPPEAYTDEPRMERPAAAPPSDRDGVQPSHYWTWRLFAAGFHAEQCALIRGVPREVILDHAFQAIEEGWPVRPEQCLAADLVAALDRVIGSSEPEQIRPFLSQLPQGTRYEDVQLYLKCRRQRRHTG